MALSTPRDVKKKTAISAFILVYLYQAGLLAMAFPPLQRHGLNATLLRQVMPVIRFFGLYHHENWFFPDPPRVISRVGFSLGEADGAWIPWGFQRNQMSALDAPDSYQRYVTRYFMLAQREALRDQIWHDLTQYAVRENARKGRRITDLRVFRSWAVIPPPSSAGNNSMPIFSRTRMVYTTSITQPERLEVEPRLDSEVSRPLETGPQNP